MKTGLCILNDLTDGRRSRQFGASAQSFAADAKNPKDNGDETAKQEIALAKEALPVVTKPENQGRTDPGSHAVSIWSRRLVEATCRSGATKAEITQAIKEHLVRMNERIEIMKARQQSARATELDVLNARYEALEARACLAEQQGE
jgi:hypothetical protein